MALTKEYKRWCKVAAKESKYFIRVSSLLASICVVMIALIPSLLQGHVFKSPSVTQAPDVITFLQTFLKAHKWDLTLGVFISAAMGFIYSTERFSVFAGLSEADMDNVKYISVYIKGIFAYNLSLWSLLFGVMFILHALGFMIALYFAIIPWMSEVVRFFGSTRDLFKWYEPYFTRKRKMIYLFYCIFVAAVMACFLLLLVTQLEYWVVAGALFSIIVIITIN